MQEIGIPIWIMSSNWQRESGIERKREKRKNLYILWTTDNKLRRGKLGRMYWRACTIYKIIICLAINEYNWTAPMQKLQTETGLYGVDGGLLACRDIVSEISMWDTPLNETEEKWRYESEKERDVAIWWGGGWGGVVGGTPRCLI